ncbi:MAG: GAF domain-containing protein [Ardenticatenaceae bacterium]|nr:GAF domain-containing protein [Ardenticatenaceae bacterium]MCB9445377.1 GAF domain-containing protein [Ardenticatenaceae bacterium]
MWSSVWGHPVWRVLFYLLIHVGGVGLGFLFSVNPDNLEEVAIFWPAAGILVAALLLSDHRAWPGLFFTSILGQLIADVVWVGRANVGVSLYFGLTNAVEALLAAYLLRRFLGEQITFAKLKEVLGLALWGAIIGSILGATLGAAGLCFLNSPNAYWLNWQLWWASDALGIVMVMPVIFTWRHWLIFPRRKMASRQLVEAGVLFIGLFLLLWFIFSKASNPVLSVLNIPYALFPFLIWAAVRFRPHVTTAVYLIVGIVSVQMSNLGRGPFVVSSQPIYQNVLSLQLFLAVSTLSSLILTAVFAELHQTRRNLEQFSKAERMARQQAETLRAANVALSESLNLSTVLGLLLDYLAELIPYDTATVMIDIHEEDHVQVLAKRNQKQYGDGATRLAPFKIQSSLLIRRLLVTRQSILVDDTRKHSDWEYRETSTEIRNWLGIPLVAQGQTLGLYSLTKNEPGYFTEEHQRLAEALAVQAGIALTNARLYEQIGYHVQELEERVSERTAELEWQYRRQAALAEVELSINQPHELQTVLDRIVHIVTDLLPASGGASIILWDAQTGSFSMSAASVSEQPPQTGSRRVRRQGASQWIMDQKQPFVVPDIRHDPFEANPMLSDYGLQAYAGVPLLDGAAAVGILYALDTEPRQYKEEDLSFLTAVAHRAATAITKVQLYEQTVHRAAELKVLYEVGKEISAQLDLDTVLQTIVRQALHLTGADKSLIILIDPVRELLLRVVGEGYTDGQLADHTIEEFRQGISGWVMQNKEPALVDDIGIDERNTGLALRKARQGPDKAVAIAPLLVENEAVGTLTIVNGRAKTSFTPNDLNLTVMLAGQAAIAIHNAQLYRAAQEADRLKSAFLASMSHELRTPLNSIIGFTGIMLQELAGPLNMEQKKQMGMVRSSAHHLLNLINDVLDISKIEAGQLQVAQEPCNVPQIITKVMQLLMPQAEKKGLALTAVINPNVHEIMSDARRIEQILINLVNNGIKFTDAGRVKIRSYIQENWLVTEVIDTGMGIKAEDIETLFHPFRQLETGLARVHEGTGLGLSISQRLVHLLGGEISVQSEWGKGSTFTFTLPLRS